MVLNVVYMVILPKVVSFYFTFPLGLLVGKPTQNIQNSLIWPTRPLPPDLRLALPLPLLPPTPDLCGFICCCFFSIVPSAAITLTFFLLLHLPSSFPFKRFCTCCCLCPECSLHGFSPQSNVKCISSEAFPDLPA